ncbi:hypothetical protein [Nostocoides sp. HKS02]|uniref:hypothetical protein n=1 Tax=Nostocoides sp. HKS02 TaxID=1813880 RepID=UPI0012B502EA|nr:hypothetical protein [Tetrasphaera sp. HKS02]QGN59203.1 hypothetical protein GKE56_16395 [Tetrasphaera sp. HKS02]
MHVDLMRDKARSMPEDGAVGVSALRIWHCNYQSLNALRGYPNLETLVVATYPDDNLERLLTWSDWST